MIRVQKIGRYTYVVQDGKAVAIMERSPFTGDWCYGERFTMSEADCGMHFRPPFQPTYRKTALAAAKVAVATMNVEWETGS